ncbi:GntR family transcriptional regulator [Arthrobacter sp. Alg241-R88]|uniref:GntR family transcriptional regulator n=1 Tax=Arthrobacter sp. Alg241-R88 TaxID=2305984 RepID=UPI0013D51E84|nr:GntR family transcriptional regulator [Arthrobacter sp. Alg241-R88]
MSENRVQMVVQESTPTLIARQLRRLIGQGQLAPGERLNEVELSQDFGVSRGPFREAVQRLTQQGLLVSIRNKGVFVVELTPEDVRDVYIGRTALERYAAELIIERGSPAEAGEKLLEAADEMELAGKQDDLDALVESDITFHSLLVSLANSPRLRQMHSTLMIETRMSMTLEAQSGTQIFRAEDHRDIARAISDKDRSRADQLLAEHLDYSDFMIDSAS